MITIKATLPNFFELTPVIADKTLVEIIQKPSKPLMMFLVFLIFALATICYPVEGGSPCKFNDSAV